MERVELDYTQRLFATRSTLAALPIELASSSRLPSPRSSSRSELLREKIAEAINTAKSDVTHPRWSHVSALIGMACTSRGYRGAADGVRIGEQNKVDVGGYEWLIPDTEKDWKYCERRWKARLQAKVKGKAVPSKYWKAVPANREVQEERLLSPSKRDLVWEKVESWKAKVVHEGDEVSPPASSVLDPALREGDTGQPSKRRTPLEFQVVKRHMPTTGSSKPAHKPQSLDLYEALATNRNTPEGNFLGGVNPHRPQNLLSPIPPTAPNIAELSEMSFLPPSFPNDLRTSTPQILPQLTSQEPRQKPAIIYPRPFHSSSPPSFYLSNSSPQVHTEMIQTQPPADVPVPWPHRRIVKRNQPLTPPPDDGLGSKSDPLAHTSPRAAKRPRTDDPPASDRGRISSPPHPPSTPIHLIRTSGTSSPQSLNQHQRELGNANGVPMDLTTPDRRNLPTLSDLLASSRRSKPRPRPPSRKAKSVKDIGQPLQAESVHERGGSPISPERRPSSPARTYFSSPASGSSHSSPLQRKLRSKSPVSPLLSHSLHMEDFSPPFVSTQQFHAPGTSLLDVPNKPIGLGRQDGGSLARGSSGIFGMGYNSQFDVEAQVGEVSALLERDVDFDNWLKDPSDENE